MTYFFKLKLLIFFFIYILLKNTELINFASPSAGCKIVYSLTSPTYSLSSFLPNSYVTNYLFGINHGVGVPEDAISEEISLGHCWPMQV